MGAARKPVLSKIWNDNKYPHTEKFQGQMITIMPGQYIEMVPEEAEALKGQFTPIKMFKGAPDPKFFKMLRVEHPENWGSEEKFTCPVTGKKYDSAEELNQSLKRFAHLRIKDENEDSTPASEAKIAVLESQIAELRAMIAESLVKRGRGRPKKDGAETSEIAEGDEHGDTEA